MVRAWMAIAWGACSGHAAVPTTPPPKPPPPSKSGYALPVAAPPPAWDLSCRDLGGAKAAKVPREDQGKVKVYEYTPVALPADGAGPHWSDRPRTGFARSPVALRDALMAREYDLTACWKWARSTEALDATDATVAIDVDPFGDVANPAVDVGDDDLRACVVAAVAGMHVSGLATRTTRATFTVHLALADQPAWKKKLRRPKPREASPSPHAGHTCVPVLRDVAADQVTVTRAIAIDDWDSSRVPPPPKGTHRAVVPELRVGCAEAIPYDLDKRAIDAAMAGNLGAFSACHRDARARDPSLAGTVDLTYGIGRDGSILTAQVDGAGDAAFHDCLRAAVAELWFYPAPYIATFVHWHYQLDAPAEPAPAADDPDALLDAGDADAALAIWAARLAADPHGKDACTWRAGVLRGEAALAPWLDDVRVTAALADLVADAKTRAPEVGRACLAGVSDVIRDLLHVDDRFLLSWREYLDWITTLLPVADRLDTPLSGDALRLVHARGVAIGDPDAGATELEALSHGDGTVAKSAQHELDVLRSGRETACEQTPF